MIDPFDNALAHEADPRAHNCFERLTFDGICPEIEEAYDYHFAVPGSQTREKLTLKTADHLRLSKKYALILANVVETLHNASLIQDDLQDNSTYRRGQPTVVDRFGKDVAMGLVNILITRSFSEISKIKLQTLLPPLIQQVQKTVTECVYGQTSELIHRKNQQNFDKRIVQAMAKSGPLFALAVQLPMICAEKHDYVEIAKDASCQFGLAYQLIDDLKDFKLDEAQSPGTNIFAALANESGEKKAISKITHTAKICLKQAARQCCILPFESGKPLLSLIDKLEAQLDSFNG